MKKVKFMLLAIIVLAIAGGILAFKASSIKCCTYCTAAVPSGGDCSNEDCLNGSSIARKTTAVGGTEYCYTTTTDATCSSLKCNAKGLLDVQ